MAMATREVSHGGVIRRIAASAAKSRTAPPAGPLSAPPNEIGESFTGAFGADGNVGGLGGDVVSAGGVLTPDDTGTSVGGTSLTPCAGTKARAAAGLSGCGALATGGKSGFRIDECFAKATAPR